MADAGPSGKRLREDEGVGDLGWLAKSGHLPRKKQDIEGVGNGSIVELQAQLFRAQENRELRAQGVDVPRTSGFNVAALLQRKNAGVEERDKKDRSEVKTAADRVGECYAALERKAQLYEKLARGDIGDEEDKYEVDFVRKDAGEDYGEGPSGRAGGGGGDPIDSMLRAVAGSGGMMTADMARERERRAWEADQERELAGEEAEERRRKHKEELLSLGKQTREERQRAEAAKARKEEATKVRRDDLKQKFLKEQIAKKLAAVQQKKAA
ncbi:hypothetical protein HYH03_003160 [Edaphochlamys debaryana]|uniref:Uncharacterized protein n=1 Tax=Edaphochlamys debaryana TaxID=47281 RepID=A0A836C4J6_9CHLO|nr:hypothetical protein HYH03_003160 [Edaphochlamys debaryana]|eukprot:KAG2498973.1 hypothetical protein HYH03_003160 [Edaphochlamys debaryana]